MSNITGKKVTIDNINFNHRHIEYNAAAPKLNDLYDATSITLERAAALVNTLQSVFIDPEEGCLQLNTSTIFVTLCALEMEIKDTDALLSHYVNSAKEPTS